MDKINVIKTRKMWKDYPNTTKWLETIQNPTLHGFTGAPDSDYVKAVESLTHILLGDKYQTDREVSTMSTTIKEDTHIVIKKEDVEKYLSVTQKMHLSTILQLIAQGRLKDGKVCSNNYYVCNTDEPYADKVLQAILEGEAKK